MQTSFYRTLNELPGSILIPLEEGQPLPSDLSEKMQAAGLNVDFPGAGFKAEYKTSFSFFLPFGGQTRRIWLLGLGKNPTYKKVQLAFRSLAYQNRAALGAVLSIHGLPLSGSLSMETCLEGAVNGLMLAQYQIGLYKTQDLPAYDFLTKPIQLHCTLPAEAIPAASQAIEKGVATAATQLRIFDLVNAPGNKKSPQSLAQWAAESGKAHGFQVQVLDLKTIRDLGMEALVAVNRGSEHPATFIIMEYNPAVDGAKTIALVGKGVTFDTGGLSLKPSANMQFMKSDMGGAAAVLGALELTAKCKLPVRLIGLIPVTDNLVDSLSIKPGDVIGSYSKKTIEVIDTDAEGRLILADALSYAVKNYAPDVLIDLATLTGSVIRTFGYECGGLFSNNDQLASQLTDAGEQCGERLWRLPIWNEYHKLMRSDVADIKNLSAKPIAGAITAAKFLEFFIDGHTNWAHLDIAGVAVQDSEFSSQKQATAYGVHLLVDFLRMLCK